MAACRCTPRSGTTTFTTSPTSSPRTRARATTRSSRAHRWEYFARALAEGFAYQGQHSPYKDAPRGEPSAHQPPQAFVDFLQNHDQTGNRAFGDRLITLADHRMVEALTAILCLSPHIPLLFMGEEWGETRPFCFFTDFHGELADAVREGRRQRVHPLRRLFGRERRRAHPRSEPSRDLRGVEDRLGSPRHARRGTAAQRSAAAAAGAAAASMSCRTWRARRPCGPGRAFRRGRDRRRLAARRPAVAAARQPRRRAAGRFGTRRRRRVHASGAGEPEAAPPFWVGFWADDRE